MVEGGADIVELRIDFIDADAERDIPAMLEAPRAASSPTAPPGRAQYDGEEEPASPRSGPP